MALESRSLVVISGPAIEEALDMVLHGMPPSSTMGSRPVPQEHRVVLGDSASSHPQMATNDGTMSLRAQRFAKMHKNVYMGLTMSSNAVTMH